MPDGTNAAGVSYTFITTTKFNTYFGVTSAQSGLSNDATMLDGVNAGGGGNQKLARHGVSALLNNVALANYPLPPGVTSFETLYNAIRNAFLSGNYEPLATVLAANNSLDHQNCPT